MRNPGHSVTVPVVWTKKEVNILIDIWRKLPPLGGKKKLRWSSEHYQFVIEQLKDMGIDRTPIQIQSKIKQLRCGYKAVRNGMWHLPTVTRCLPYLHVLDNFLSPTPLTAAKLEAVYARFPKYFLDNKFESGGNQNYDDAVDYCETELDVTEESPNDQQEVAIPVTVPNTEENVQLSKRVTVQLRSGNVIKKATVIALREENELEEKTALSSEKHTIKQSFSNNTDSGSSSVPQPDRVSVSKANRKSTRKPQPSNKMKDSLGIATCSVSNSVNTSKSPNRPTRKAHPETVLESLQNDVDKVNNLQSRIVLKKIAEKKSQEPDRVPLETFEHKQNTLFVQEQELEKQKLCLETEKVRLCLEEQSLKVKNLKMESELLEIKLKKENTLFEMERGLYRIQMRNEKRKARLLAKSDKVVELVLKKLKREGE